MIRFLKTAAATLGLSMLAALAQAAEPAKTVVLVHGAFADGSGWNKVIPLLQAKGLKVIAVQNPLTSFEDDVAATKRALDEQTDSVVLVGHSWGGVVITQAGEHERVKSLVYVAAFAPDVGESITDMNKNYPVPEGLKHVVKDKGGFLTLTPEGMAKYFAQDLPASETRIMAATQGPVHAAVFDAKPTAAAWKNRPSWYIVSAKDHMIAPELEAALAKKIGAKTISLPTSHVPQASRPKDVAKAIIDAAMR